MSSSEEGVVEEPPKPQRSVRKMECEYVFTSLHTTEGMVAAVRP